MVEALRPHRSTKITATMVKAKMHIAEIPEARKVASEESRPACLKSNGAYYARSAQPTATRSHGIGKIRTYIAPSIPLSCCIVIKNTPSIKGFRVSFPKTSVSSAMLPRIRSSGLVLAVACVVGTSETLAPAGTLVSFSKSFSRSAPETPRLSQAKLASSLRPL